MATEAKIILAAEDRASRVLAQVKGEFAGMSSGAALLKTSLASLTAGLSVGALVAFARNVANGLDALNDMSDATGATVENLSALEDVAARNGTSLDTVSTAMVKFNSVLTAAQEPGSQAANVLKAIGLNSKELQALDPAEALRQTAVALAGFADDGNKARVVQELFGKSIKEVAPFLKDLAEQQSLQAKATTEQAKAAEAFNKEIFALQKNFTDLARFLAGDFITAINAAAKAMRESGFLAGMGVLFGGDAGHKQNVELANLVERKLAIEKNIEQLSGAGEGNRMLALAKAGLADVDKQIAAIMRERNLYDGTNQSPAETARLGRRESIGYVPTATPKGSTGKTDAQREAERRAEETRQFNIGQAIAAGEAVNKANEQFQRERSKAIEDEINFRRDTYADEVEAITASNLAYQNYKKELLDAGPAAQLEKSRKEMQLLAEMFERGEISSDQYLDAVTGRLGLVANKIEETKSITEQLGMVFESAAEDAIVNFKSLGDVFNALGQDVLRVTARMLIMEPLMKSLRAELGGDSGGDWLGKIFRSVTGAGSAGWGSGNAFGNQDLGLSFAGGGYTGSGSRSGGLDGQGGFWAMLHPQETVTDHTRGGSAAKVEVNIYNNSGAQVRQSETVDSRGNRRMDVTISEMVAGEMRRPGSGMHQSARASFGLQPALVGR